MYQEWFEIFNKIKEEGRKKMWIDWLDKVCLETNSCPMCRKEIRIKMCKFCDANILEALAINNKDEAVIINQDVETKEYFIDGLEERIYIDYCPMCRKEAR